MSEYNVEMIPALSDNYIYRISWDNQCLLIDPAEPIAVNNVSYILNTHHHSDHVGGNRAIKKKTGCQIIGPDDSRIPGLDRIAKEGEDLQLNGLTLQVLFVPGHTTTHIAYYVPEKKWLFSGDSLFTAGCGRLFEGTPEQMLASLKKLMQLPKETLVFCGHEYTRNNLEFALSIEPNNAAIKKRLEEVKQMRAKNQATVPATLEVEMQTNPFLRSQDPALKKALGMENATELEVFTQVRKLKDTF